MGTIIRKVENYYKLETKNGIKIFYEPIPIKLKILVLEITKNIPIGIKEEILHKVTIDFIKETHIYEMIIEKFQEDLYYREMFESP